MTPDWSTGMLNTKSSNLSRGIGLKGKTLMVAQEQMILKGEPQQYRVLALIADSASPAVLLPPAIKAAKGRDAQITLLHVILVPDQLPYSAATRYLEKARPLIEEAAGAVEAHGIPVKVSIRVSHRAADAIIDAVTEENINLLVMELCRHCRPPFAIVGKNIYQVMNEANCVTLIIQRNDTQPFRNILVALANPDQIVSVLEKAWFLAENENSTVELLHIFPLTADTSAREKVILAMRDDIARFKQDQGKRAPRIILHAIDASKPVDAIVKAAGEFDCVVLSSASDSWFKRRLFRRKMTQIARRIEPPLILIRSQAKN